MGMKVDLADIPGDLPGAEGLMALMAQDKKVVDGKLRFILARGIGAAIARAVDSSPSLRNKKDLIEAFVVSVSATGSVDEEWEAFISARRAEELAAIVADEVYTFPETYHLEYLNVMSSLDGLPTATIRMRRDGEERQQAAIGVGCVDAVYKTMDLMIDEPHELVDYVVRSVTGGTDALADVTVKVKEGGSIYTGRAASLDIVQSSARAYIQAINKLVHLRNRAPGNLSDRNL